MPLFVIERDFGEQLQLDREIVGKASEVNEEIGGDRVFSFPSADKKKTCCLYEAPSAEAIREPTRRLGTPADVIIEVDKVRPKDYV